MLSPSPRGIDKDTALDVARGGREMRADDTHSSPPANLVVKSGSPPVPPLARRRSSALRPQAQLPSAHDHA
ncbi:hypothetical protein SCP_0411010 [Sparassis crispa]|uniref:Uncharacterized protein n=1 Tax=Sparassis crispa TaxID=139825 RepID=A0A401GKM6_9APHY|nr:hypothetical protein SCP_0411010 [Sparassis crispa]GBE82716.1 hypothetical protein SCP_0411010 [Sparassis crispa]